MNWVIPRKHLLAVAACLLALAVLFWGIAGFDGYSRQRREDAVYDTVLVAAAAYGVSPAMVLAVISTESDFRADARSPVGAIGLMQLMPDTFAFLRDEKLKEALADDAVWDTAVNIRYGTYYLSYLFERFGTWETALAAYNAGEGRVVQWLNDPALSDGTTLFTIPYEETEHYVAVTLTAYRNYLKKYNFKE